MKSFHFAIALIVIYSSVSSATGLKSLEKFVQTVSTGRCEFTQVVTSPGNKKHKTSIGSFAFARPDRFRFNYVKPFLQTIVADGNTVWLYDSDLNQVTKRKQSVVLGATPAALIAAAPNVLALQQHYTLSNAPDRDGLQWVLATPTKADGSMQSIQLGFTATDAVASLAVLEMMDSFGQRSVLRFDRFEVNPVLPVELFRYKPPAGADVME
jgi:outer membrane lipoprotein carrier protein